VRAEAVAAELEKERESETEGLAQALVPRFAPAGGKE